MKKLCIPVLAIAACVLLSACSASIEKPEGTAASISIHARIADYFPANDNTRLIYQGTGNEFASYEVYTDYTDNGLIQQRISTGGTTAVRIVHISKNRAEIVYSQGETYFRQNMLDLRAGAPEALLKAPLETGRSWLLGDGRIRTITGAGITIETPAGSFDTIEVTTEGPYGKSMDYYAKDVGIVKTVYVSEGGPVISELSKVEKDVPLVQTVRFYYPNAYSEKLGYIDKEVGFYTNDITRDVLANTYKEAPPAPLGHVFSSGSKINSLYLNKDGMVYIDLNEAFAQEMNAGAAYEQAILQSVANTFGRYYGVMRVMLTVEGQPYVSGHIAMRPGEYLTVDDGAGLSAPRTESE